MSKRVASNANDDAPTAKRVRIDEGSKPSPLADEGAWRILEEFLTTSMTYPQMEEAFQLYLGLRYSEDEWKEARLALFSGDGDDDVALENLRVVKAKHIPQPPCAHKVYSAMDKRVSRARVRPLRKLINPYLDLYAGEDDDEEEVEEVDEEEVEEVEEDLHDEGKGDDDHAHKVTCLPGSSSATRFTAVINNLASRFEDTPRNLSLDCQVSPSSIPDLVALASSQSRDGRMYLLHVHRNITDYVAKHLRKKNFRVIVSAWLAGQLYVLADSPKTISDSLPFSLYLAVKQYVRISDEEREAVERSRRKLPNPAWVRIKNEKYKGDIAQVFDSDLPNDFVAVLVPPWDFPYSMPRGSRSLLDRSRLLNGDAVSNISRGEEVIGCKYKGERYYLGLLLKNVHRDRLEPVVCPHVDDIQLHLQSGWNRSFLKTTVHAFAMQFLRVGDRARIVKGDLCSEIGQVVSTDHPAGSVTLALILSGNEVDIRLEDIKRIFKVGDSVRVVAGPYLGVEGYIIQMMDDIVRLCQDVSKEELEVSKYYIDGRPLSHTLQARLPTQQLFEPPPCVETIQIGDSIDVLVGEHMGKSGIVRWLSKGGNYLWFQHESSYIPVPIKTVQRIPNLQTLQYTQDRGYDVKAGDVVKVARGPEYLMKGVVRSVDFPNARLTLLAETDHSLVDVPIGFVIKVRDASLDSFKKDIGQEVYIIGGDRKGYRAMLYSLSSMDCTVALHGQQRTKIQLKDVATR
ncbi:hypothetical protein BDR03DRAFT_1017858 [Suillus americanus]|nr:hypothetical protein BDR03DRAFT_1017858 [Suillus americanus]